MRKALLLPALLFTTISFALAQANAGQQEAPDSAGTEPATQDPEEPQKQMPPGKQPPPPQATTSVPAASSQVVSAPSVVPGHISPGTTNRASLDTPLSTRTSRVGDRFTATVTAPIVDPTGNLIVPIGAKVNGQITEPT